MLGSCVLCLGALAWVFFLGLFESCCSLLSFDSVGLAFQVDIELCNDVDWRQLHWFGLNWDWFGFVWFDLVSIGLIWFGLVWIGLFRIDSNWRQLVWFRSLGLVLLSLA